MEPVRHYSALLVDVRPCNKGATARYAAESFTLWNARAGTIQWGFGNWRCQFTS